MYLALARDFSGLFQTGYWYKPKCSILSFEISLKGGGGHNIDKIIISKTLEFIYIAHVVQELQFKMLYIKSIKAISTVN